MTGRVASPTDRPSLLDLALVVSLCFVTMWLQAPGLTHPAIPQWDESMHQAATRGTYDSFFRPHLYVDPLHDLTPPEHAIRGGVWLHMPVGPFWLGALLMHLTGVTPLALRLVSLLADILVAVCLFWYARPIIGRWFALIAPVVYLTLPFLWRMTQGWQFGDASDTALAAGNLLAVLLIVKAVESQSLGWSTAAGAAIGATILCKSGLAFAPIGVAAGLAFFGTLGFCRGLRWRDLLAIIGGAAVVAAPWSIYTAWRFPKVFEVENAHALGHFSAAAPELSRWRRPFDAVLNEVHRFELTPLPIALPLVALAWLLIRGLRRREPRVIALALWMAGTWGVLSLVSAKAPGLAWGAIPATLTAIAILASDAIDSWPLTLALVGPFLAEPALSRFPRFAHLRELLPQAFVQTRAQGGLVEGLVLAAGGVLLGAIVTLVLKATRAPRSISVACTAAVLVVTAGLAARQLWTVGQAERSDYATKGLTSFTSDLGPALAKALPKQSLLDVEINRDPPATFLHLDLMFWSGLMTYVNPSPAVLKKAEEKGYHRYLVTPSAEPLAPVDGIPSDAWLRAYDPEQRGPMAPLPTGSEQLDASVGDLKILGFGSGAIDASHDRYAVFASSTSGNVPSLAITFHLKDGTHVDATPGASLGKPEVLKSRAWFIIPVVGPPRASVQQITFGEPSALKVNAPAASRLHLMPGRH